MLHPLHFLESFACSGKLCESGPSGALGCLSGHLEKLLGGPQKAPKAEKVVFAVFGPTAVARAWVSPGEDQERWPG